MMLVNSDSGCVVMAQLLLWFTWYVWWMQNYQAATDPETKPKTWAVSVSVCFYLLPPL